MPEGSLYDRPNVSGDKILLRIQKNQHNFDRTLQLALPYTLIQDSVQNLKAAAEFCLNLKTTRKHKSTKFWILLGKNSATAEFAWTNGQTNVFKDIFYDLILSFGKINKAIKY